MMDAMFVVQMCEAAIRQGAAPYNPERVGVNTGRVLFDDDGNKLTQIRVQITYPDGEKTYATIDCTIDNAGHLKLREHGK